MRGMLVTLSSSLAGALAESSELKAHTWVDLIASEPPMAVGWPAKWDTPVPMLVVWQRRPQRPKRSVLCVSRFCRWVCALAAWAGPGVYPGHWASGR